VKKIPVVESVFSIKSAVLDARVIKTNFEENEKNIPVISR